MRPRRRRQRARAALLREKEKQRFLGRSQLRVRLKRCGFGRGSSCRGHRFLEHKAAPSLRPPPLDAFCSSLSFRPLLLRLPIADSGLSTAERKHPRPATHWFCAACRKAAAAHTRLTPAQQQQPPCQFPHANCAPPSAGQALTEGLNFERDSATDWQLLAHCLFFPRGRQPIACQSQLSRLLANATREASRPPFARLQQQQQQQS